MKQARIFGENEADPIMVPNLDDSREQEKLRGESSDQCENNKAQRKFELIEKRLKAMEGSDVYSAHRLTCICTAGR